MTAAASPCRTYIVYHHGLFAQGVRRILEDQRTVQVVGMESNVAKALGAVRSLQPEVVIVEESTGKGQPMRLGAFLHSAGAGRVVTLSLDHDFATVYQWNSMAATDPADLVKAIQGVGKSRFPGRDKPHPKASMLIQSGSGANGDECRSGRPSRLGRTRQQRAQVQVTDKPPRASRRRPKGG